MSGFPVIFHGYRLESLRRSRDLMGTNVRSSEEKNYLFAGSDDGARRAAMLYSFMGTCKINNVNPFEWLRDILTRIPNHLVNKLEELLPKNWVKSVP